MSTCINSAHLIGSPLSSKVALFDAVAKSHIESQAINPFSNDNKPGSLPRPKISKEEYGRPIKGSLSEARSLKANIQICKEMLELCEIIHSEGEPLYSPEEKPDDHRMVISFGELFSIYTVISDKLVGMLLRARKHKLLDFEGECLFQRRDDHVPVILLQSIGEIRTMFREKLTPTPELSDERFRSLTPTPEMFDERSRSLTPTPTDERRGSLTSNLEVIDPRTRRSKSLTPNPEKSEDRRRSLAVTHERNISSNRGKPRKESQSSESNNTATLEKSNGEEIHNGDSSNRMIPEICIQEEKQNDDSNTVTQKTSNDDSNNKATPEMSLEEKPIVELSVEKGKSEENISIPVPASSEKKSTVADINISIPEISNEADNHSKESNCILTPENPEESTDVETTN